MKWKYLLGVAVFLMAVGFVVAQQPTMVSLQGKVTDPSGSPTDNGNLRVTLSTSDSCEQNVIYDYTYNNLIQGGLFSILLGNDSQLNMTYNSDYYLCTWVNGQVVANSQQINRTKFRGGQGQIPTASLANGTLTNTWKVDGNLSVNGNLTVNGTVLINGTAMINGSPIIVSSDAVSNVFDMDVKMGSQSIAAYNGDFDVEVLSWQPPAGEVWEITSMILNLPMSVDISNGITNNVDIIITNGTYEQTLYTYNITAGGAVNATLLFGNGDYNQSLTNDSISELTQGKYITLYRITNPTGKGTLAIIQDKIYISNSNYLKINMTNGDLSARTGYWWVQGKKIKNADGSKINDMDVKMGSQSIAAYNGDFDVEVLSWQPPAGEVWEITNMILNLPMSVDISNGITNNVDIIITNGTYEQTLYTYNITAGGAVNATLLFRNGDYKTSLTNDSISELTQGKYITLYRITNPTGKGTLAIIQDKIYISNSNYLKINMTNGDLSARTGYWFVQGIRVK